jgi:hypothetical protein
MQYGGDGGIRTCTSPSGISKLVINITHLPPEAPPTPAFALEQPQWQPNQYRLSKAGINARFDRVQVFDFSFWQETVAHRSSALASVRHHRQEQRWRVRNLRQRAAMTLLPKDARILSGKRLPNSTEAAAPEKPVPGWEETILRLRFP